MQKLFLFLFLTSIFSSCKKPSLEFACDPAINEFVLSNRYELSKISTQELVSYDLQLQRAIFNSWAEDKKRSIWVDKFKYLLSHEPFTAAEAAHIRTLIDHFDDDYFNKEILQNNLHSRSAFAAEWVTYATKDLKWSKKYIAFIVYRLYTDQSQLDRELSNLQIAAESLNTNSEAGNCSCNTSSDFCSLFCERGGCQITTGCGWVWSMSCDGSCY